jgi:hypothetical protein
MSSAPTLSIGATVLQDYFDTGFSASVDGWADIAWLTNAVVDQYTTSSAFVAISDVTVTCDGVVHAALVPDSWGAPTSGWGVSKMSGIVRTTMTTTYSPGPHAVIFSTYISPQLFPKILAGEPPRLWLFTPAKKTVKVDFRLWRQGFRPMKPT